MLPAQLKCKLFHMTPLRDFSVILILAMLSKENSGARETNYAKVFVSPFGRDSSDCGTEVHPCQSIAQAVRQVDWEGTIYLNGSGTENLPYSCSRLTEHRGICINKSLNMIGVLSPHIYCTAGLYFLKKDNERKMQVRLSGIDFWRTPLICEDCQCITLVNCTFRDAPEVLSVHLQNITTFQLDITGYTLFENNSLCLMLLFLENIRNISRFVTVNVSDTHFTRNGFHFGRRRTYRGGLKMESKETKAGKIGHIHISCKNVKYFQNVGSFLDLNIRNVLTNETYEDVNLTSNNYKQPGYPLYHSNAKEPHVKFIGLRCTENPNSPCIRIKSEKTEVDIHGSFFYDIFQAVFLESKISASLRVFYSKFIKNKAYAGGSLFATSPGGFLKINLTSVFFSNCKAKKFGCMIAIGKSKEKHGGKHHNQSIPGVLNFTLRNATVEQWAGRGSKCSAISVFLKSGKVTIEKSRFYKKRLTSVDGPLNVKTLGGISNVTVLDCSFIDKCEKKRKGIAFQIVASNGNAGTVTVSNCLFISSGKKQKALVLSPKYRIRVINITVISFRSGFQVISSSPKNGTFPVNIHMDNCTFMNNIYDMMLTLFDPTSVNVTIQNTVFTGNETIFQNSYAIRLNIPPLKSITSSVAVIKLYNDTFDSKPSSNFALFFKGKKEVSIKRCTFRHCTYTYREAQKWVIAQTRAFYTIGSGAISILTYPDSLVKNGCLHSNTIDDTHPSWHYESRVIFEDTVFEQNLGLIVGGVHISNGFTTFKRCAFKDNFGSQQSGHIYSPHGTGRIDFEDCLFSRTKESMVGINSSSYEKATFLHSQSGGPVTLKNTSLISAVPARKHFRMFDISSGGYVDMDNKSTMQCSKGSKLLFENATHVVYTEKSGVPCILNFTALRYSCLPCPPGYYSLQKGTSQGLFVNFTFPCLRCPFGATCVDRNIAARPDFWGYQNTKEHQQQLQFFACPEHYCQSPSRDSKGFNDCRGKRNGTLCGKCAKGFTESLFSSKCSKATECGQFGFWIGTIMVTSGLVLYLLVRPSILSFLGRQILWYRRHQNGVRHENHEDSESGFIKITFYFYQVAELLMFTPIESRLKAIPFLVLVISALNFQITTINNKIGCPFSGLTAVTKQLLLSGTVLLAMAIIFILYFGHLVINVFKHKEKPKLIHYMAVFMEVLLLGYERLAETSLKLMYCVPIGSGKRLFIDGNVPCLQWWQYILLAYIAVFVLPFTLVLYWGSLKLYKSFIKASEFLAACVFPLPFLIYWLCQNITNGGGGDVSDSDQEVNQDVLKILHGPFRSPDADDKGSLYWESVLIGRRLILLTLHTFITDTMLRGICMTNACMMMTIHHVLKNPYKDPLANKAETLSLAVLTLIAVVNLPKEILFSFGAEISTDTSNGTYLEMLKWIEVGAMAFIPALVSLLVTFALLSQLMRIGVMLFKYSRRAYQYHTFDWVTEETSHLITTEESRKRELYH